MDLNFARAAAHLLIGEAAPLGDADTPIVTVKSVERSEFESACRSQCYGEVIVTRASSEFAVADLIRTVDVVVKDVQIGKLHFRFYKEFKKVKRNFVTHDSQVRKLLGRKRERIALSMVDWLGDTSEEFIRKIAREAIHEVEQLCTKQPTHAKSTVKSDGVVNVSTTTTTVERGPEKVVNFSGADARQASQGTALTKPVTAAIAVLQGSVEREAKGQKQAGVVVEMGTVRRPSATGGFNSFCLKLDVDGRHIPYYGVELERECAERGVKAGQVVEVTNMGKQALPGGKQKNLFKIQILR